MDYYVLPPVVQFVKMGSFQLFWPIAAAKPFGCKPKHLRLQIKDQTCSRSAAAALVPNRYICISIASWNHSLPSRGFINAAHTAILEVAFNRSIDFLLAQRHVWKNNIFELEARKNDKVCISSFRNSDWYTMYLSTLFFLVLCYSTIHIYYFSFQRWFSWHV